jgi:hypothetical protein
MFAYVDQIVSIKLSQQSRINSVVRVFYSELVT